MKLGIMSDSATGFSLEELKKYPQLMIVPMVITDQEGHVYEDNERDINSAEIYQKMIVERKHLKTSQTNRAQLAKYWDQALTEYEQVLFLPIADSVSGQYQSAKVLQKESKYQDKIHIWETGSAFVSLKFMSLIALKFAKENKSIAEIIVALTKFRESYKCYISPNNLTYLVRGGRVPSSLAHVANFLKLKPILRCKNKITKVAIKRTINHAIKEMLELLGKTKDIFEQTLYIINAWCDQEIIDKAIMAAKVYGFKKFKIENMCNILKVHTGNNTIGFALVENEWVETI